MTDEQKPDKRCETCRLWVRDDDDDGRSGECIYFLMVLPPIPPWVIPTCETLALDGSDCDCWEVVAE